MLHHGRREGAQISRVHFVDGCFGDGHILCEFCGGAMIRNHDEKLLAQRRKLHCQACGSSGDICKKGLPTNEAHHIKTRGSGGGDDWWNVLTLCVFCHKLWHSNIRAFFRKAPFLVTYLKFIGWEFHVTKWKFKMIHPAYRDCGPKEKPQWKVPGEAVEKLNSKQINSKLGGN